MRAATDRQGEYAEVLTHDNIERILASSGAPDGVDRQIDLFLHAIGRDEEYFGRTTKTQPIEPWIARAFLPDEGTLVGLAHELAQAGYINFQEPRPHYVQFSLRIKAWERLRARQVAKQSSQVFVARWFCAEMERVHDDAIVPAVQDVGLVPYCVNREHFTDPIDDTIIAEIRRSRAVIVDVTGERPSVYFEAGFARGLEIPVIWTCNASWTTRLPVRVAASSEEQIETAVMRWNDRLHFDTEHFPHIMWTDAAELRKALVNRLRALGISGR